MALNGNQLGDAILSAITAAVQTTPAASAQQREAIWRAVGSAIVAHIQTNATVTVNVASVSGVTPGGGASGPGTGTGTVG